MAELIIESPNIDNVIKAFVEMPKSIRNAQSEGSSAIGFSLQKAVRTRIESGAHAQGDLDISEVARRFKKTASFTSLPGTGNPWERRLIGNNIPFQVLGKLARYRKFRDGKGVVITFGAGNRTGPGDRQILEIAKLATRGKTIAVSPGMRRLFGLQKKAARFFGRAKPGQHFFPLRKTTTQIEIKPRDLLDTPFLENRNRIPDFFSRRFYPAIKRDFRKA